MNSVFAAGPPKCEDTGSQEPVANDNAVDSVYPYPSKMGQHAVILRKSMTSY